MTRTEFVMKAVISMAGSNTEWYKDLLSTQVQDNADEIVSAANRLACSLEDDGIKFE